MSRSRVSVRCSLFDDSFGLVNSEETEGQKKQRLNTAETVLEWSRDDNSGQAVRVYTHPTEDFQTDGKSFPQMAITSDELYVYIYTPDMPAHNHLETLVLFGTKKFTVQHPADKIYSGIKQISLGWIVLR
ncbi:hypothetical protein RRG08_026407 [Elysia crispata]|uniref:Uncharacterized protein n=1 Tax=Elysia crispata TaxID=231223 RepID=A0AAE1CJA1_9GAST|nr:hypothetical protein RRG08_026407 [Elysia crispata]